MEKPAHLTFIKRYLNWERARERLDRYKNIANIFPLEELQACSEKAPFYCHYLSWRLGTWEDEGLFEFFDKMLDTGINLPGWDKKSRVPGGCEFDKFWGFVWELQTAAFFHEYLGLKTEWNEAGPDFKVSIDSRFFFAECTTYRKSFALEEFIGELFRCINPQIMTEHVPCLKFSLPKNNKIETFLDDLFKPYLDSSYLPSKLTEVQHQTPVILPIPPGSENFFIYLENQDATNHNFELQRNLTAAGDPKAFLKIALKEILGNKASSNKLLQNRPNLLMVNFLLGRDWQLARSLRPMPKPDLGETFDGVFLTACGIDKIPTFQSSFIDCILNHPVESIPEYSQNKQKRPPN